MERKLNRKGRFMLRFTYTGMVALVIEAIILPFFANFSEIPIIAWIFFEIMIIICIFLAIIETDRIINNPDFIECKKEGEMDG